MKNSLLYFILFLLIILVSSCSSYKTISIKGNPGTEIYLPTMEKIGQIENNGKVKIKLYNDYHCPFLVSRNPGTETLIPFALDYKKYNSANWRAFLGFFTFYIPCIGLPSPNSDRGLGVYTYRSPQSTNENFSFIPIVDNGVPKPKYEKTENSTSGEDNAESVSNAKRKTSESKRTFKNYAGTISGTYIGIGTLTKNNNVAESYSSIEIVITRIDNNTVYVNVIESEEPFFSSELKYNVTKTENGYNLNLEGISSATITIDTNGNLTYSHPKVKIDNEIYTLKINATK